MELNHLTLRHPLTLVRKAIRKIGRYVSPSATEAPSAAAPPPPAEEEKELIDVAALLRSRSLEEFNRTAEAYFATLADWNFHLAKPFSTIDDAPALLINFATMIQGLRLLPGHRVLDFGAGSGWTSRFLSQLGCESILLDVSPTALEIAARLYTTQPLVGDRPKPRFLPFDGRTIDLPDASVDRILSFDAFHHAPNPDAILAEFARVLVEGGIAAFAEPGPHHSKTPQSQFEMRTYGVLENDVDLRRIWDAARACGFADIRVAAYNIPPMHFSIDEYEDLLRGGEPYLRWAESTRAFLGGVRNFFLRKSGVERLDSRRAEGLACEIDVRCEMTTEGQPRFEARVTNRGTATWLPSGVVPGGVSLGAHLYDAASSLVDFNFHWQPLTTPAREIAPGETLTVAFIVPALAPGEHRLEFDCVSNGVAWFAQLGSKTAPLSIVIGESRS